MCREPWLFLSLKFIHFLHLPVSAAYSAALGYALFDMLQGEESLIS